MRASRCAVLLSVLFAVPVIAAENCSILPIKIGHDNPGNPKLFRAPNDQFEILFHQPDRNNTFSVASEDFEILSKKSHKSCSGQASIDADVAITANQRMVVAVAYSSDVKTLDFMDPSTCKTRKTISWKDSPVSFQDDLITIDPFCRCHSEDLCLCQPAQIYKLGGASCMPALQEQDSRELTLTKLGVTFDVPSYVANPRMPKARVIKPANP